MLIRKLSILLALLASGGTAVSQEPAEGLRFASGDQRVAMIELYTSEGCNSCPPADRWLSGLKQQPGIWRRFVPLAFHVDYWDYIGWTDRFASADHSNRQRRYAAEGNARFVYTPGVFRNGLEWQDWRRDAPVYADSEQVGNLSLNVDGKNVRLRFDPVSTEHERLHAHVAILGMDLETRVGAGENVGKTLRHDFVVLEMRSLKLDPDGAGFAADARLPVVAMEAPEHAIVAWVNEAGSQSPIQVVGGRLPVSTSGKTVKE